jgi:hypothetical protein
VAGSFPIPFMVDACDCCIAGEIAALATPIIYLT